MKVVIVILTLAPWEERHDVAHPKEPMQLYFYYYHYHFKGVRVVNGWHNNSSIMTRNFSQSLTFLQISEKDIAHRGPGAVFTKLHSFLRNLRMGLIS